MINNIKIGVDNLKGFSIIVILVVLALTGCSNTFIDTDTPLSKETFTQTQKTKVELEIITEEYRAVWEENYLYDEPQIIENYSDWVDFFELHPESSPTENVLKRDFTANFFNENILYAYLESEPSGSILLLAKAAEIEGDKLILIMERIIPEVGSDDMATRICLFGINRDEINNVKSINVTIDERGHYLSDSDEFRK
jgi:hypothetical protein